MKLQLAIASSLLVLIAAVSPCRADELTDSLAKIPESANAIAVINVDAIYKSPRSYREGWPKKQEIADKIHMPTSVGQLVIGYHVDQGEMDNSWRVGVVSLKKSVPMEAIAAREKAPVETLGGQPAVSSPRNCYFVGLGPMSVGVTYPGKRQETARWLQFAKSNKKPVISEYLQTAATSDRNAHIIAAFDLEEMVEPRRLQAWLRSTETFKGQSPSDINEMHKTLVKLRGIRLSARVYDQSIVAKMSLDFAGSPKDYGKVFKSLFAEALEDFGIALEDVRNCQVQTSGNTVTLQTNLSDEGLARIMALMLIPESDADSEEAAGGEPTLAASQRYYTEVKGIVDELRKKYKTANNYYQTATWHESYAKKIERLPAGNVDPDLVKAGGSIAGNLHALAASLRGVPLDVNYLEAQKAYRYSPPSVSPIFMGGGRGGGFSFSIGPPQYEDNFAEIRTKQAEVLQRGASEREKLWKSIDDEMAMTRQRMSEKFKTDFDAPAK